MVEFVCALFANEFPHFWQLWPQPVIWNWSLKNLFALFPCLFWGGIKKCVKSQLTNVMSVYIYHKDDADDEESQNILRELEHIDDECDQNGITFVKIDNAEEAKEYGIEDLPTIIYFEDGVPTLYEG